MKTQQATGNCFEFSFHLLLAFNQYNVMKDHLLLVHGIVWHEKTGYHIHGWVEDQNFCYDLVKRKIVAVEKKKYYELGKVKTGKGKIFKYKIEDALIKCCVAGSYYFSDLPCKQ